MFQRSLNVRPGEAIKPAFAAAAAAVESLQLRPSEGAHLTSTPLGTMIASPHRPSQFGHPWKPSIGGDGIRLSRGAVNGYTPVIRKGARRIPMVGSEKEPVPALPLKAGDASSSGQSWICVEVHPDDNGNLTKESLIEIVHRNTPTANSRLVGRQPLVLLVWNDGIPSIALQITYFNLRYLRSGKGENESDPIRHLFL